MDQTTEEQAAFVVNVFKKTEINRHSRLNQEITYHVCPWRWNESDLEPSFTEAISLGEPPLGGPLYCGCCFYQSTCGLRQNEERPWRVGKMTTRNPGETEQMVSPWRVGKMTARNPTKHVLIQWVMGRGSSPPPFGSRYLPGSPWFRWRCGDSPGDAWPFPATTGSTCFQPLLDRNRRRRSRRYSRRRPHLPHRNPHLSPPNPRYSLSLSLLCLFAGLGNVQQPPRPPPLERERPLWFNDYRFNIFICQYTSVEGYLHKQRIPQPRSPSIGH